MAVNEPVKTQGGPPPGPGTETKIEMAAFDGRGTQLVDLAKRAPFGWWPVAVLALVSLIDRMEQSVLAGALGDIQDEFGFSDTLAGLLATGAGLAALVLVIPAGFIADRVVRTRAIAGILILWSLLSLGTGLAANFAILFAFRMVLGGASVLNNPMGGSLLGDFYPRAARGKAYGIERLMYFLGNPIGIIFGGVIAGIFGWRWVFIGLVIPGLIIAAFVFFLKEPKRGLADSIDVARESRDIPLPVKKRKGAGKGKHAKGAVSDAMSADSAVAAVPEPQAPENTPEPEKAEVNLLTGKVWRDMLDLFKERTLRLVLFSQGLLFLGLGGLFFWTTRFYERAFDLSPEQAAPIAGGMGMVGILLGFALSIRLGDRYQETYAGWRVLLGSIGASVGVVGLLILALSPSLLFSALGWVILNIGFFLSVPAFTASLADLSGSRRRGLVFALSTLVIQLTSSVAPVIIGGLSDIVVAQGWADSGTSLRYSFVVLTIPVVAGIFVALRARSTFDAEAAAARRGEPTAK